MPPTRRGGRLWCRACPQPPEKQKLWSRGGWGCRETPRNEKRVGATRVLVQGGWRIAGSPRWTGSSLSVACGRRARALGSSSGLLTYHHALRRDLIIGRRRQLSAPDVHRAVDCDPEAQHARRREDVAVRQRRGGLVLLPELLCCVCGRTVVCRGSAAELTGDCERADASCSVRPVRAGGAHVLPGHLDLALRRGVPRPLIPAVREQRESSRPVSVSSPLAHHHSNHTP